MNVKTICVLVSWIQQLYQENESKTGTQIFLILHFPDIAKVVPHKVSCLADTNSNCGTTCEKFTV